MENEFDLLSSVLQDFATYRAIAPRKTKALYDSVSGIVVIARGDCLSHLCVVLQCSVADPDISEHTFNYPRSVYFPVSPQSARTHLAT